MAHGLGGLDGLKRIFYIIRVNPPNPRHLRAIGEEFISA
jgi:hypothetical protein